MGNVGARALSLINDWKRKPVIVGETGMVGILVSQVRESVLKAALTLLRSNVGFIFKIRYHCTCLTLSVGLAINKFIAMVSTGSVFATPFRVGGQGENLVTGTVWKVRAGNERVAETYRHQPAKTVLWTLNKFIAATNKQSRLALRA